MRSLARLRRLRQQGLLLLRQTHTLGGAAAGELLAHPDTLKSPAQLGQAELESLAFILGTKEEVYQSFARRGHDQAVAASLLSGLDASLKQVLVQKLVAASGAQGTPLLLAWASEELRKGISALAADKATAVALPTQPWYPGLLSLAAAWAARQPTPHMATATEQQCLQGFLQAPGALRWADLLALPFLPQLLAHASSGHPLLPNMLHHLGLEIDSSTGLITSSPAPQVPPHAISPPPQTPAPTASTDGQAPDALSTTSTASPALQAPAPTTTTDSQAPHAPAPTTTTDSQAQPTTFAASALDLELKAKQYLMSQRKLDPAGSPPAALVTQVTQAHGAVPADQAVAVLVLQLVRYARAALGQSLPQAAAITLRLLRCPPTAPQLSLDSKLVQAAAGELLVHCTAQKVQLGQLQAAELEQLLQQVAAAKPLGSVQQLLAALQVARKASLLQGDPWSLATATSADIDLLTPTEFYQLQTHAHTQAVAGTQLSVQLLGGGSGAAGATGSVLNRIWALPDADRSALAWVVLRGGAAAGSAGTAAAGAGPGSARTAAAGAAGAAGAGAAGVAGSAVERAAEVLLRAFVGQAGAVVGAGGVGAQAARELAEVVTLEREMAELDLLGDREAPPLVLPPAEAWEAGGPGALPSDNQLAAARAALPESQLLLFDLLHQDLKQPGAQDPDPQRLITVFNSLLTTTTSPEPASHLIEPSQDNHLPTTLAQWVADSKKQLVGLSPAALALLSRFLALRVERERGALEEGQARLKALLGEVLALLEGPSPSSSSSSRLSPYWVSADSRHLVPSAPAGAGSGLGVGPDGLPSPEAVTALLGPLEGSQFEAWLKASALTGDDTVQPYQILDDVHREQDLQRYLTMEHDPQIHMVWEVAPRPWHEAAPMSSPEEFLEEMRPALDRYLEARGMRPLLAAEWDVYHSAAVAEFTAQRAQHEEALRSQGHSAFFNSRAEAVYLRALLSSGISPSAPLAAQASRYLTVLEANDTWTFMQKKRVVQRLVELSAHFAAQPPPSERGSPFAPLFAPGTSATPLVPALKPWREARREARNMQATASSY